MGRRIVAAVDIASADVGNAAAKKTLIQVIAPANHPIEIHEIGIGFAGAVATHAPRSVDMILQTDAGTMSALALKNEDGEDTAAITITAAHTATAEPTAETGQPLRTWRIHPQTQLVYQFAVPLKLAAAGRIGIRVSGDGSNDHAANVYAVIE